MITQDEKKKRAAEVAVNYIKDGMVVGLGTGSTVMYLLEAIARQGLKISGVTTSKKPLRYVPVWVSKSMTLTM